MVLLLLIVLDYHSLHDFEAPLEGRRVQAGLLLLFVLGVVLLGALLLAFALFLQNISKVGVEYFPLGDFVGEVITRWRLGGHSLISDRVIYGLRLSFVVVKFISEGLFDDVDFLFWSARVLSLLVPDRIFNQVHSRF